MGRLRAARHRLPEGRRLFHWWRSWWESDNGFPLRWVTTQHTNFGEQRYHQSIPAGGCGAAHINMQQMSMWRAWSDDNFCGRERDPPPPHFCDAYESVYCMCVCVCVMEVFKHPQWKVLCQSNGKTETHVQLFGIFPEQLKDEDYCNGILHWRTVTPLFPIAVTHEQRQTWSHTQARRLTFCMYTHTRETLDKHGGEQSNNTWDTRGIKGIFQQFSIALIPHI